MDTRFVLTGRRLLLGLLMIFLLSGCNVNDNHVSEPQSALPPMSVLSVNDHWPAALVLAQKWHSDAYLLDVSIDVLIPNVDPSKNDISFGFHSLSNGNKELVVSCSDACYSKEFTSTLSLPQCLPLEINDSLLEGKQALSLALQNADENYVNDKNMLIDLHLERNPPCRGSTTAWRVEFMNIVTFERVRYIFDAVTGELLETR